MKEAETIKLPDFPKPETYRSWKTAAREATRATSDQPDAAFAWILEVYKKDASHEKLRHPGKFLTLDTKLLAALEGCQERACQADPEFNKVMNVQYVVARSSIFSANTLKLMRRSGRCTLGV